MPQLPLTGRQSAANLAQRLGPAQLAEQHGDELSQLLNPRACRSALCLRAAVSKPVREMSCKICEKMLHTLFKAESSSDSFVFANSTYQRLSAFFFPPALSAAELIWTRVKLFIMDVIRSNRRAVLYLCLLSFLSFTLPLAASGIFRVSASPSALSIPQNGQGVSTITTTIRNGFNGSVGLSASGVPMGTSVSFNPQTIPAPGAGNSTMTITVGSSTPTGTYPITVTGNGGGTQQNTTVSLTVTAQQYDVGIDFRSTQNYVTDPAYAVFNNCLNDGTKQQTRTNSNG